MDGHLILRILQEVSQVFVLVASLAVLFVLSLPFVHDIIVGWRKMTAKEILLYCSLAFGTGRLAIEGLLSCWYHWF